MEEKEFNTTFAIPANYTDSGKIFGGMLEPRNAVEALILILAVGYPELMLIPMATTIRIVVMTVTLIPIGILAAMGIDGDSLFQYAGHIICYQTSNLAPLMGLPVMLSTLFTVKVGFLWFWKYTVWSRLG